MTAQDIEVELLTQYLHAAFQAVEDDDPKLLAQRIEIYKNQLENCEDHLDEFDKALYISSLYDLKAFQALCGEGFVEKISRDSARDSTNTYGINVVGVGLGLLANNRTNSRMLEAISFFSKSLEIQESSDIRLRRAGLYLTLNDRQSALEDVEYLLANYSNDQEVYFAARELKSKIETSKSRCFIATAVYAPSDVGKIDILRDYRDRVLLKTAVGEIFVSLYYVISPSIARVISKSIMLKSVVRTLLLDPIVKWVSKVERSEV